MTNTTREWSQEQQAIFNWFSTGQGNLVVRARAGTGKTTTIMEGMDRAPEQSILLAAFNKDIAKELQSRVNNPRVEAKTLHSLGFKFVMRNWKVKVDIDNKRADQLARQAAPDAPEPIVKVIKQLHTKAREVEPFAQSPSDLMDVAVRFDLLPDEEWEERGWGAWKVCEAALHAMELAKAKTDTIDFADMIFLPLVNKWVRPWFDMVVVDEAQDMTVAQLKLATGACKRTGRICVVGDDRQAIYGFRGADSGSLDRLKKELRAHETSLTITYRCPKRVVKLAAELVPDYKAAPTAPEGTITNIKGQDKLLAQATEGDFILSRSNAPLVRVCLALLKVGKRARIKGRDIGRQLVALVKRLRVRDISQLEAKMDEWQQTEMKRAQKLGESAEERIAQINDQHDVVMALADNCTSVEELLTRMESLFSDDAQRQAIMLSTVHRAKGLETNRVFLLKPTFFGKFGEELNIMYVAITRAKSELVWAEEYT